jgi:hypothetical protein
MIMKKIITRITAVLFLGLLIMGCDEWETYENPALQSAPDVTLSLVSVQDSTVTVGVNTNASGYVSVMITDDTTMTEEDVDGELLLIGNISGIESQILEAASAGTVQYSFSSGLIQNSYYQVFAVASNEDGMYSSVQKLLVQTDDSYAPYLKSTAPSKSTEAAQENTFSVELEFSEPVQLSDDPVFKFSYYYDDEEHVVDADNIVVDGSTVTVSQNKIPHNGEWVFLSWEEGAVTDFLAGTPNKVAAQTSGVVEGALAGLYWRVQHVPFDVSAANFMPEVGSSVSDAQFDIMYKFPFPVSFALDGDDAPVYEEGDINVTFWEEGKKVVLDVPFDHLGISDDSTLVISLPEAANYGNWVSVNIAEGVVVDTYENPNAAFESDSKTGAYWLISYGYTRDMIIGTYTFSGVSYWEGNDESFDVEIIADPEDDSKVIINGFYGSATPIPATFDGDFATLTVSAETDYLLGDLFDDGGETYFWSYDETQFVINILPNGNMVTDPYYWLALYWVAADESDEGWVNIFVESTWTKKEGETATTGEKSGQIDKMKILRNGIPRNGIRKNN